MASVAPEVVFFYGPPFPGKTLFYAHEFSQTHARICPHELFEADPSLSLRAVILKVVNVVSKGQSVVLDDEKSTKKSRKSYLNIIRNKVPYCSYRVVQFHVNSCDGLLICEWAREWQLAYQSECLSHDATFKIETVKNSEHWFEKRSVELPVKEEGFSKIDQVEIQLICDTPYKFVVPALFLQWEGLFDDAEEVQCNAKRVAIGIIGKWSQSNPCGRVIVFHLSAKQPCPEGSCEYVEKMKRDLSELATQTDVPVYFVHFCSFMAKFSRPPDPGLFAWLQRLHTIDLSSRATFCVCSSDAYQKAASAAGVKSIKADKLLQNPGMINAVHVGLTAQAPDCVKKAKLAWFSSQIRPSACVPLFLRAKSSCRSPSNVTTQCFLTTNNERVHGVCFKDFSTFDSFNSCYQNTAVPTKPASRDIFKLKDCLSKKNVFAKKTPPKTESNTPPGTSSVSHDKTPLREQADKHTITASPVTPSLLAKNLSPTDIEGLAFSPGHFRRGEGCVKLIRNVSTSMEQEGVLFAAKCLGSQGQLYNVSALLNQEGVVRAVCSCADPASKLGKCKHSVGLLLWCKEEKNVNKIINPRSCSLRSTSKLEPVTGSVVKQKKTACDESAERSQGDEPTRREKNKSFPNWISSFTKTSSDGEGKRAADEGSFAKLSHKRMKTKKSENTFYCLSPEELLQTAEEILQEYHVSYNKQTRNKPFNAKDRRKHSTADMESRAKLSNLSAPQSQENTERTNIASSVDGDLLIKETFTEKSLPDARSSDLTGGFVVPETVTTIETQSHCKKDDSLGSNESSLIAAENGSCEQEKYPDLKDNKKRGKQVRTSILDDFI